MFLWRTRENLSLNFPQILLSLVPWEILWHAQCQANKFLHWYEEHLEHFSYSHCRGRPLLQNEEFASLLTMGNYCKTLNICKGFTFTIICELKKKVFQILFKSFIMSIKLLLHRDFKAPLTYELWQKSRIKNTQK